MQLQQKIKIVIAAGLMASKGRIFSMGSSNAILELILAGATPHIKENLRDSRKEVDRQLKTACEALIQHATDVLAQELNLFMTQVFTHFPIYLKFTYCRIK